ncbi:calcium-transporting ATPase 1 endoplasmic reticulum-type-like [Tripterygium wilfordii]|uniref:P-type Ca(2+) transporter n=1 Tax=Tripterygium wilfordii TaxID=458696 RepID=A0A7J7DE45_TRIWF|nr:calcium-transporting ATPase 4, endoplasmic reticulum-type-like [Tripterygium wilfordii]XP_038706240.1 calcium-transporting ATPase 4, endoplasmic reticulum-type-like [Tripterygium wilfordii]KAF5744655.1 calcium-transporting ATPase 1 endoplasmic reticulum-type-like [Tripterygium wilfordii]
MGRGGQDYGKGETLSTSTQNKEIFPAWSKDVKECEEKFQVNRQFGLSAAEVEKRRQIYGYNELEKNEGTSIFKLILDQFNDTLVRILLAAAIISFVLAWYDGDEGGEMEITAFVEPLVIFLILILNAIVGVWQESNAEKALEALKEIQPEQATVIRDGKKIANFPARELVPGDIVELRVGDKVPADMRVLSLISSTGRVEQGSLTGESEAVNKTAKAVAENSDIQGKKSMVFAGTTVVNGNCMCLVTQTGMDTEIGKVHSQIQEASQTEEDTPLKKKLNEFGEVLTMIIGLICLLVWLINVKYFLTWEYVDGWPRNFKFSFEKCTYYFEIAVALAVAAIPEGLPAVITTCLALGTRKMAQKNALVRKLPSVETLGCTTVICSDKTGTLTTNQMAVAKLVGMGSRIGTLRSFNVEGTTYSPFDGKIPDWPVGHLDANLQTIAKIAAVCNDAGVEQFGGHYVASGMPTEAALKVMVEKMGFPGGVDTASSSNQGEVLRSCQLWNKIERRIATLEFDRDRKSMGVIVDSSSGRKSLLVKGAVENVLERSSHIQLLDGSIVELDQYSRDLILENLHELSSGALRCLGFAFKEDLVEFATYNGDEDHPSHKLLLNPSNYSKIESKLVFVGLVGLRDPPRKEVRQAIEDCKTAGIRVMVITGDNKNTAEAICREIGVFGPHEDITSRSLTGRDFMDHPDQKSHLRQSGGLLFSRAEPRHKQEIVRLLKNDGEVVAMTGDGVNDAPALKLADIGIAMGIAGTEVAKEASDMVLADDNFSTIVAAVGEGRSIYNNMKAFIRYMISSNIGEVASIFLTAALGIPEGMIPVQLLWVNLVTDGPPATALGFNPPDKDIMKKPPRRSDDSLITAWILFRYLVIGLYVGIATVGIFIIWYTHHTFFGIDLSEDGHSIVTYSQLANWGQCSSWEGFSASPFIAGSQVFKFDANPCEYFQSGKIKASTLSLSVLVAIEMFNSLNALSEDGSLLTMPPWVNPWLLLAMSVSFGLHFLILYVPFLAQVFGIVPLSLNEWLLVLAVALPVILIDEVLKFIGRCTSGLQNSDWSFAKHKAE